MEFEIEDNVPVPSSYVCRGNTKYPFLEMKIGQSFVFQPGEKLRSFRSCASSFGQRNNMKFTVQKQDDGSYRCWRIA